MRDYGEDTKTIWDGDENCKHEWQIADKPKKKRKQSGLIGLRGPTDRPSEYYMTESEIGGSDFCQKCGAWYGQLGLESSLDLYLSHLWQITDELYRVLRKDGILFWNHGDCYGGNNSRASFGGRAGLGTPREGVFNIPLTPKCLVLQNYRLILGMIDIDYRILVEWRILGKPEGKLEEMLKHSKIQRILRNSIVWHKSNAMPSSVSDRLSNVYESVFMLVKNNKPLYYYNTKTRLMADTHKGTQGEEGEDWEWREHTVCQGKGCDKCENGFVKRTFWQAVDYWFDLDAVRVPHTVCGVTDKRPMGILRQKLYPNSGYNKSDDPHLAQYKFNYRVRDAEKKSEQCPQFKATKEEIERYKGKHTHYPQDQAESFGSPRARYYRNKTQEETYKVSGMRNAPEPGEPNAFNIKGKNPGDIFVIPTHPFPEAHFATFPPALIHPLISAGCPQWVCSHCGKARVRIIKCHQDKNIGIRKTKWGGIDVAGPLSSKSNLRTGINTFVAHHEIIGWADCGCNAEWKPGIVLDPFMGSGTTAVVAKKLGRQYIGIDISPKYVEMANKRIEKECGGLF